MIGATTSHHSLSQSHLQISDGKVVVLYRVKLIGDITPAMKELLADMRILKVSVNIHCEYTKSNISRFAY